MRKMISKTDKKDTVKRLVDQVMVHGGEGLILQRLASSYDNGRSNSLIKLKVFSFLFLSSYLIAFNFNRRP